MEVPAAIAADPNAPTMVIDGELNFAEARVRLARFVMGDPVDHLLQKAAVYRLNLCMTPRPLGTRACFVEQWGPHRFEPVGDLFLAPPNHVLRIRGDAGRQVAVIAELPSAAVDSWLDHSLDWNDRRLEASLDASSPVIRALLIRLAEETQRPGLGAHELSGLMAAQLAIELARYLAAIAEGPVTGGLASWRLRTIDARLHDIAGPPTLSELAEMCSLSVRQLTRGFRASRGCSIHDHIAHARIEGAKRLLAGEEGIKAIAFATGYASPSSFAFAFRQTTGVTPREFRQRVRRTRLENGLRSILGPCSASQ
jgi:AraC family transcriptional regulator